MLKGQIITQQNSDGWTAYVSRKFVDIFGSGASRAEAIKDLMYKLSAADTPADKVELPSDDA